MTQAIAYNTHPQITLETEETLWSAFYEAVPDGEYPQDVEALEKLIRAQPIVTESKDLKTREGLRYDEILAIAPVVDRPGQEMRQGERFIWIALSRGDGWIEACMADESGLDNFEHMQIA